LSCEVCKLVSIPNIFKATKYFALSVVTAVWSLVKKFWVVRFTLSFYDDFCR